MKGRPKKLKEGGVYSLYVDQWIIDAVRDAKGDLSWGDWLAIDPRIAHLKPKMEYISLPRNYASQSTEAKQKPLGKKVIEWDDRIIDTNID